MNWSRSSSFNDNREIGIMKSAFEVVAFKFGMLRFTLLASDQNETDNMCKPNQINSANIEEC